LLELEAEIFEGSVEALALGSKYQERRLVSESYGAGALHVALTTVA